MDNPNKLQAKDLVNIGIYSAIYLVITCVLSFLSLIPVGFLVYGISEIILQSLLPVRHSISTRLMVMAKRMQMFISQSTNIGCCQF